MNYHLLVKGQRVNHSVTSGMVRPESVREGEGSVPTPGRCRLRHGENAPSVCKRKDIPSRDRMFSGIRYRLSGDLSRHKSESPSITRGNLYWWQSSESSGTENRQLSYGPACETVYNRGNEEICSERFQTVESTSATLATDKQLPKQERPDSEESTVEDTLRKFWRAGVQTPHPMKAW
jgi:hypothetical protein